jgi:uncharacterized membrane protein YesL
MIDRMLRDRLLDAYMGVIPLVTINVIWFVASLPLVTAIPAAGALFYATNQMAHGKPAGWQTFIEGFRLCFRRSWGWGLLNLLVGASLVAYLSIFSRQRESWATWASAFIVVIAFLWLTLQIYVFPLLLEQVEPKLGLAFRNSLVLMLRRPMYSFGAALLLIVLAVGSTILIAPAWFVITGAVCAYLANRVVLNSIRTLGSGEPDAPAAPPA